VDGRPASRSEAQDPEGLDGGQAGGYENAGNASAGPGSRVTKGGSSDVSVEVVSARGTTPGHLAVAAGTSGDTTLVTLTASGSSPVRWSARTGAAWLYLSRSSGTLEPGESMTVKVYVDHLREPAGRWTARVAIAPAGTVVTITGYGKAGSSSRPGGKPDPTASTPTPSGPGSTPAATPSQDPSPTPADPTPTATATETSSPDPGTSSAPPGEGGDPGTGTS